MTFLNTDVRVKKEELIFRLKTSFSSTKELIKKKRLNVLIYQRINIYFSVK